MCKVCPGDGAKGRIMKSLKSAEFILERGRRSGTFRCTRDTEHKKNPRVGRRGFFCSSCEHLSLFQHGFSLVSRWSTRDKQNVFLSREEFLIWKFKNVFNIFCSLLMYLCVFVGDSSVQCVLVIKFCIAVSCDWWWLLFCLSVVAAAFSFTWKLIAAVREEKFLLIYSNIAPLWLVHRVCDITLKWWCGKKKSEIWSDDQTNKMSSDEKLWTQLRSSELSLQQCWLTVWKKVSSLKFLVFGGRDVF